MSDDTIQYILAAHWEKRPAVSIAALVRAKFKTSATADSINTIISKYSLRHGGKPVKRKDWPCKSS